MGAPKPSLGYASRTEAALAMSDSGETNCAIATALGIAPNTVASLLHSGRRAGKRNALSREVRTVLFDVETLDALTAAAAARGITANELARRIVETAVEENMIDAILDDGEDRP